VLNNSYNLFESKLNSLNIARAAGIGDCENCGSLVFECCPAYVGRGYRLSATHFELYRGFQNVSTTAAWQTYTLQFAVLYRI